MNKNIVSYYFIDALIFANTQFMFSWGDLKLNEISKIEAVNENV
jgi:hypothetical protein